MYADCIKPEVDIEIYVSTNRTGYSRPTPMLYENHYTGWLNSETVFGKPLAAAKQIPAVIEQCIKFIEDKVRIGVWGGFGGEFEGVGGGVWGDV